jgi:phospholipid/cholesterol/gamma-HCH transport system substrate-binding protein
MPTSTQKIRLGIFIFISSFALIILLFIVGSRQFFQESDVYFISYSDVSVSGLEIGSPVKNLGVKIGSVQSIDFDPNDANNVILTISLKPGTSIRSDARANIETIGITGLKMIEIRGGSNEAEVLKPGAYIIAGSSITEDITGRAEIIADKIERVINNLLEFSDPQKLNKIIELAETSTETMDNINKMVVENRVDLRSGLSNGSVVMARLDTITAALQFAAEKIRHITASDTLDQIVANVHEVSVKLTQANLVILVERLSEVVEKTNRILVTVDKDLERGSKDFLISLQKLKSTMDYLNEIARIINEDPSILVKGGHIDDVPDDDLD